MHFWTKAALVIVSCAPAFAGAILNNGSGIYLGVDDEGQLNVPNGTGGVTVPLSGYTDHIGLYSTAIFNDGVSWSCLCEGWGVASDNIYRAGANNARGNQGTPVSFVSTASTATAIVTGGPLTVTHSYAPSASSSLFEGTVTITNNSSATVNDVKYRRVVDWDYPRMPQSEYVTIQGWPASALYRTSNGGFQSPNPLMPTQGIGTWLDPGPGGCPENANFTDCGPRDQGALFDFNFGSLGAGQSTTFYLYYGAAATEAGALAALSQVGAEVYSLAQASDDPAGTGSAGGSPRVTFMLGFRNVGGVGVSDPSEVPEPLTSALCGFGLLGLGIIGRRRAARK